MSSTRNRTPRGMTAISPGAMSMMPNSVRRGELALLRYEQHLAVGVVEHSSFIERVTRYT